VVSNRNEHNTCPVFHARRMPALAQKRGYKIEINLDSIEGSPPASVHCVQHKNWLEMQLEAWDLLGVGKYINTKGK